MKLSAKILVLFYQVLHCLNVAHRTTGPCSRPLGLMSGSVHDWQLSASSSFPADKDPECHVRYARLHQPRGRAWCAKHKSPNEWILVDLGVAAQITGVMTQGRGDRDEWVTDFTLSYSQDAFRWEFVNDPYGNRKVFVGNSDAHSLRHSYLDQPVTARFVRLHILHWYRHPSLRLEIIGCQECNQLISSPPFTKISASSHQPWSRRNSCEPEDGHIHTHRGWCSRHTNQHQWLQFDLGPATQVTGILTKGRADTKRRQWVTSYTVSYSNDSVVWFVYKDGNQLGPKVFAGNMDKSTERHHYLNHPFTARYVRINPITWHHTIALRAGLTGCPHTGECGPGFVQVNPLSSCVANLAYGKGTWVNDKRHGWADWQYGRASLAVDGILDNVLPRCAILDNYYSGQPLWMVDLGWREPISGIIIVTWQGQGQDKVTSYRDYVYNLDRLTVYVANRPRLEAFQLGTANDSESESGASKCGTITRANNALFQPRLHFECPGKIIGRYVYIKAVSVANRWSRLYSAVLCEVLVY
ncbi:lactadherin-like isoform X2 [Periplaneta americana]